MIDYNSIGKYGKNTPLLIPRTDERFVSLCNPSILWYDNQFIINLRDVNYALYHSIGAKHWMDEGGKYQSRWGPSSYIHPENEVRLETKNWLGTIENGFHQINMTLDNPHPNWEFWGLEDARLVYWIDKLYITGVRRDTTSHGQGRMELSEIDFVNGIPTEVSRCRIEHPYNVESYCEKNWMPVLDRPFHFVSISNPTEVVVATVNGDTASSELIARHDKIPIDTDMRGGSQLIPYDNGYFSVVHDTVWWRFEGRSLENKDGIYKHRFVLWDNNFKIKKVTKQFMFLGGQIEFCCGVSLKDNKFFITYGFQDTSAHLLELDESIVQEMFDDSEYVSEHSESSPIPIIKSKSQEPIVNKEYKPTYIVVDDFLENPDEMREMALNIPEEEYINRGSVGFRSKPNAYGNVYRPVFEKLLGIETNDDEWNSGGGQHGCFQWSPAKTGQVVHCDDTSWAGIIFLTPNAPPRTGTWLMRHKETGKRYSDENLNDVFIGDEPHWDIHPFEKIDDIGNVYNRLILWNGRHLHTAGSYFGQSIVDSRLYQVFFFNEKR